MKKFNFSSFLFHSVLVFYWFFMVFMCFFVLDRLAELIQVILYGFII